MLDSTKREAGAAISAVARTMRILETFVEIPHPLSVAEIAEKLGIEKSIVSRILASLTENGYVDRDPLTDRHSLTLKMLALAFRHAEALGFPQRCLPILQKLADDTDELVQLGVVQGRGIVFLASAEGELQRVKVISLLGRDVPLHASSGGKAWLSTLEEERAATLALAQGLARLTSRTITRVENLLADLRIARERGYAMVEGEYADGANGIAAPIGEGRFGCAVGVVTLSGPDFRFPPDRMHALAPQVIQAARELESIWPLDSRRLREASMLAGRGGYLSLPT